MQEFTTPMMQQYMQIKKQYADCLLFFRLGDFYELFLDDAKIGAQVLGITLTGRPKGKDGRIPMAGVPFHAVDAYISKLVKGGYKVAICEQITEPNSKGIVQREVVRVVTPGTLLDEKALERKENNYICALDQKGDALALVYCDVSTGSFWAQEIQGEDLLTQLSNQLTKTMPAECILPQALYDDPEVLGAIRQHKSIAVFAAHNWSELAQSAAQTLKKQFNVSTLASFNIAHKPLIVSTAAALLRYIKDTQKSDLAHIRNIQLRAEDTYVHLDRATIINLELFSTIRERDAQGSFLSAIDHTQTAMGGRMLKSWVLQPLTKKNLIEARLTAVSELMSTTSLLTKIQSHLFPMNDLERILARITIGVSSARELAALAANLKRLFDTKHALLDTKSILLQKQQKQIKTKLWDVIYLIENTIVEEPPLALKEGGVIKDGVDKRLDQLRSIIRGGREWIANLEREERVRTGISSLKLKFNKVFGFYIEISNANRHLAPDNYIRKQTLVNGERFITPELKEKEDLILKSEDQISAIEYAIYKEVVTKVLGFTAQIQKASEAVAYIDCLASHAQLSKKNKYTKPTIVYSHELRIKNGRHPVVEQMIGRHNFVPNSTQFGPSHASLHLITGPNMAGKSVYLRQIALIVLIAHMGCFVPAQSAQVSIVDAIFVRSGASDVITSGLSTFMVEMVETAYILNQATSNSLILMDEIGRGTSTYDGVSIAWATAEYVATHFKPVPKTVFATHYFELTKLEEEFPGKIKNMHMSVKEDNKKLTFLHLIKPGSAEKSFGVAVASLAGMPEILIKRATQFLNQLEAQPHINTNNSSEEQSLIRKLKQVDVNKTTPIEALTFLSELKEDL